MKVANERLPVWFDECVNEVEAMLSDALAVSLQKPGQVTCDCEICLQDIACIVLNKVSPRYYSNPLESKAGTAAGAGDAADIAIAQAEVRRFLAIATEQVGLHPHH